MPPGCLRFFFGDRVVSVSSPGIAAQYAPNGEAAAFPYAKALNGFDGVGRTGGQKPAGRPRMRGNMFLIKPNQSNQQPFHWGNTPCFFSCFSIMRCISVLLSCPVRVRATNTISQPPTISGSRARYASRITRRHRLRTTAVPIFFPVVIPIRGVPYRFLRT